MSTTNIQLLRSSIEQKRPSPSVLLDGQVALNLNYKEPGLFFRLTNGQLTKVGPVAYSFDGLAPNTNAVGFAGNAVGEEWLDDRLSYDNAVLKVFDGVKWTASSGFTVDDATGDFSIDRDLTLNVLHAKTVELEDPLILKNDLLAKDDCAYNVGHDLTRFNFGYFCNLDSRHNVIAGGDFIGTNAVLQNEVIAVELSISGKAELGTSHVDTLKVNSSPTFEEYTVFNKSFLAYGHTTLGNPSLNCADTLTVNANSVFHCPVLFKDEVTFEKQPSIPSLEDLYLHGNTVIGNECSTNTLVVESTTTMKCRATFERDVFLGQTVLPSFDNVVDLGSPTQRFANIYTGDLHLKNERGDWTMVEEDEYLTLRNNKTGKTFRLVMEEL
jgi:hypothetical protein